MIKIDNDIPLAPLTTFHIGGPARYYTRVKNVEELREAFAFAKKENLQIFILGGGSNILVDDAGFDGLVIKVEFSGLEFEGSGVTAGAGESWDQLAEESIAKNLSGIENLSGIPGTVGGAVVQNIGAYGAALSQVLTWVEVYDRSSNKVRRIAKSDGEFGYRDSFLKHDPDRYVVLRAELVLSEVARPNLIYKDLAEIFKNVQPSLFGIREEVLRIRKNKFPDLRKEGSAGSFFKNPILSPEEAQRLRVRYPEMPVFSIPESSGVKVPLAWILDHVLAMRGHKVGHARLFEKQPLVITASRGASSREVMELAHVVEKKVEEAVGIRLEPEVYFVA